MTNTTSGGPPSDTTGALTGAGELTATARPVQVPTSGDDGASLPTPQPDSGDDDILYVLDRMLASDIPYMVELRRVVRPRDAEDLLGKIRAGGREIVLRQLDDGVEAAVQYPDELFPRPLVKIPDLTLSSTIPSRQNADE
jgi:hypothetical protein